MVSNPETPFRSLGMLRSLRTEVQMVKESRRGRAVPVIESGVDNDLGRQPCCRCGHVELFLTAPSII